jgi:hypothetical protein
MRFLGLLLLAVSLLFAEIQTQTIKVKKLDEPSGLLASQKYPGVFWSHNDSGDKPRLFAFDATTLKRIATIKIKKAKHVDWEDITYHQGNIIIGDFGNNKNRRDDLTLYTIEEPNPYQDDKVNITKAEHFIFSDQKTSAYKRKNFDCEAMFSFNDSLYLLTKHRADHQTTLYVLEDNQAKKIADYPLDSRVTSADSDGKRIAILTYQSIYILEPKAGALNLFHGDWYQKKLQGVGQVEGVALEGSWVHIISEEGLLYSLHVSDIISKK